MEGMKNKIILTEEKETLLIPLYGKARENEKEKPILTDRKAAEIIGGIDYDFSSLKIAEKTNIMMCLRAKLIDGYVKRFLDGGKGTAALHLGCGLDSRYNRIGNDEVDWYDVDFEEVIGIRRNFCQETDRYHLVASSVTEPEWIGGIPADKERYIVIAEGLFMYLTEDDIKTLIGRLRERIGGYTLIFDAFSMLTAKHSKNHPSLRKTGARIQWGVDDPHEPENWGPETHSRIQFLEEQFFTSNEEVKNLDFSTRMLFQTAGLFSAAKKAHRILVYRID